jgi:hypothetical protein
MTNSPAALGVLEENRSTVPRAPSITPVAQRDERRGEVAALLGGKVLVQLGPSGISTPLHDSGCHEAIESITQDVRRDPEAALEISISARTGEQRVADDEQTPSFPDSFESPRDGADLRVVGLAEHTPKRNNGTCITKACLASVTCMTQAEGA